MAERDAGRQADVHLLWTSGWDSTFRLLQLLYESDAVVQPWYVRDPGRHSTAIELRTMQQIRDRLAQVRPELAERLLPLIVRERSEIPEDPAITAMHTTLRTRGRIGGQYDWLSRMARHEGLDRLELGIHDPRSVFGEGLSAQSVWEERAYGRILVLAPDPSRPELELFRPFAFPLMGWRKLDMQRAAEKGGFADLLELTWFCHEPRWGRACGLCRPCQQALEEDLARRMPLLSRVIGRAHGRILRWRRAVKARVRR